MGANVSGYALEPNTMPNLYHIANVEEMIQKSYIDDVRNYDALLRAMKECKPEIVIHMAAQPLVRESYKNPIETYAVNVMGTVNLFEAARQVDGIQCIINVTTDKCYENKEWIWAYRENEALGGYDPYSNSKACSELVTSSFRNSFFHPDNYNKHGVAIASARAGNVIGGGDWAADRLVPDIIRAIAADNPVIIRNPNSIRPWQHVLEPLSGYIELAEKLVQEGIQFAEGWNFGPSLDDAKPVEWIVKKLCQKWGGTASYRIDAGLHPHEATFLKLDISKANHRLNWYPKWGLETALDRIIEWNRYYQNGQDMQKISINQINNYSTSMK